jgi:hypothetical protein
MDGVMALSGLRSDQITKKQLDDLWQEMKTPKPSIMDILRAPRECFCIGPQPGETKCPCRLRDDGLIKMETPRS